MYVSTFDKDLLATDLSVAKVLRRILAVGRRTSDVCLALPKSLTQPSAGSQTERLLQYLAEIGKSQICTQAGVIWPRPFTFWPTLFKLLAF